MKYNSSALSYPAFTQVTLPQICSGDLLKCSLWYLCVDTLLRTLCCFKQAGTQPDFFTHYGNTVFPREKNCFPESDKLFQMDQAVQKHTGVAEGLGENCETKDGEDITAETQTVGKQAHVMVGLQGAWQIANRLMCRKY